MRVLTKDLLAEYVSLQVALISALAAFYDNSDRLMRTVPRQGKLLVDGVQWAFKKHGLGVRFNDADTRRVVDIHKFYDGVPDAIDAWRILQFYEERTGNEATEREIEEELQRLMSEGFLLSTSHDRVYRIMQ